MNENHIETEVKLYVPYLEIVQTRLDRIGARLTAPRVYERNVRYENAAKTLTAEGIVVRLRQDSRVRLTYKSDGDSKDGIISRYEAEVEVSDFETMETILGKLGYFPHMTYEKYRTTYEFEEAEIVLDELPYGNFIEIEGEREAIEKIITRLQLGEAPRMSGSYVALFDYVRRNLNLQITDLTFANFAGMDVPESAFHAGSSATT
jgi:adenylate cyclase class 2